MSAAGHRQKTLASDVALSIERFEWPPHLTGPARYGWQRRLRELLPNAVGEAQRILDFGGGRGRSRYLFGTRSVVGFDVDRAHVAEAGPGYCVADGQQLPFADAAFGFVFCNWVLEYVPQPQRALAESARVLAPGGRMWLAVPTPWQRLFTQVGALPLRLLRGQRNLMLEGGGDEHYFRPADLRADLHGAGFEVERCVVTCGLAGTLLRLAAYGVWLVRRGLLALCLGVPAQLAGAAGAVRVAAAARRGIARLRGRPAPALPACAWRDEQALACFLASQRRAGGGAGGRLWHGLQAAAWKVDEWSGLPGAEIVFIVRRPG